jgi:G:T-mismatch repair DNA endonuclease (very short patch repair protein)
MQFGHGHECPRGSLPSSHVDFWQSKIAKNQERDDRAQKQLRKEGWKVLTVWECETKNKSRLAKRGDDTKVRKLSGSRSCGDARAFSNSS